MDLYLDGADVAELEPLLATGLFRGVTTNPLILHRAGVRLDRVPGLVSELRAAGAGSVFVQTTCSDTAEIVDEGVGLHALSEQVVVKIPATRPGLAAARRLVDDGVPVLVTAVYHPVQAVLAAAAGARWIAPYLGRMTRAGLDGAGRVADMNRVLAGTATGVLAASIPSIDDVTRLAATGIEAVTLPPALAAAMFVEPGTSAAVADFDEAIRALR